MKSRPSSADCSKVSRVSRPDFGAYRMPTTAPSPKPARNQPILPLLSSDMISSSNFRRADVSTHPVVKTNPRTWMPLKGKRQAFEPAFTVKDAVECANEAPPSQRRARKDVLPQLLHKPH